MWKIRNFLVGKIRNFLYVKFAKELSLICQLWVVLPLVSVMPAVYSKSKRGGDILHDACNYTYHAAGGSHQKTQWACTERRKVYKCPASAQVCVKSGEICFLSNNHNHSSNLAKNMAKSLESLAINKAKANPSVPTRTILKDLASDMNGAGSLVSVQMKNKSSLARIIRKERSNDQSRPAEPRSFEELYANIPEQYTMTTDKLPFLIAKEYVDDKQSQVMLIFMSDHGKNLLRNYKVIQCDGTFDTCPAPFDQIYFILACTPRGKAVPAVFCLLPNRTTATYTKMFQAIEDAVGTDLSHLQGIGLDFELAVHNVVKQKYKQAMLSGCLFHHRQA